MKRLESLGEERQRTTLSRQGTTAASFGVPYAALYKLEKELAPDQPLALSLWETGNHDARVLAGLIADPTKMGAAVLDRWAKTINNEFMLFTVAGAAARTSHARLRVEKWIDAKAEWVAAAGWNLCAAIIGDPDGPFDDSEALALLARIASDIGGERNRVKHSMNYALISMSARSATFGKKCSAAAKRIGTVVVDHGNTSCKTPAAVPYIEKMMVRAAAKRAKSAVKKKKKAGVKKKATAKKAS